MLYLIYLCLECGTWYVFGGRFYGYVWRSPNLYPFTTPGSCFDTGWATTMILPSSCKILRPTTWRACTSHSITSTHCPWLLHHSSQNTPHSWSYMHHYQPVWSSVWIPIPSIIWSWCFYWDQRPVELSFFHATNWKHYNWPIESTTTPALAFWEHDRIYAYGMDDHRQQSKVV